MLKQKDLIKKHIIISLRAYGVTDSTTGFGESVLLCLMKPVNPGSNPGRLILFYINKKVYKGLCQNTEKEVLLFAFSAE